MSEVVDRRSFLRTATAVALTLEELMAQEKQTVDEILSDAQQLRKTNRKKAETLLLHGKSIAKNDGERLLISQELTRLYINWPYRVPSQLDEAILTGEKIVTEFEFQYTLSPRHPASTRNLAVGYSQLASMHGEAARLMFLKDVKDRGAYLPLYRKSEETSKKAIEHAMKLPKSIGKDLQLSRCSLLIGISHIRDGKDTKTGLRYLRAGWAKGDQATKRAARIEIVAHYGQTAGLHHLVDEFDSPIQGYAKSLVAETDTVYKRILNSGNGYTLKGVNIDKDGRKVALLFSALASHNLTQEVKKSREKRDPKVALDYLFITNSFVVQYGASEKMSKTAIDKLFKDYTEYVIPNFDKIGTLKQAHEDWVKRYEKHPFPGAQKLGELIEKRTAKNP